MTLDEQATTPDFADLAAEIVSAYVTKNSVRPADLPSLIVGVHKALSDTRAGTVEPTQEPLAPAGRQACAGARGGRRAGQWGTCRPSSLGFVAFILPLPASSTASPKGLAIVAAPRP